MNLYRVFLKGFSDYRFYVLTNSMDDAYRIVYESLQKKDYGYIADREVVSVELIASDPFYAPSQNWIFIDKDE